MLESVFSFGEYSAYMVDKYSKFGDFLMTTSLWDMPLIDVLMGGSLALFIGVVLVSWVVPA